jgi:PEP-CTERM motif
MGAFMNRKLFSCLILALGLVVLLSMPGIASADDVTWSLSGVTFFDGGTATGSFVYNADTNTVSSVDIATTAGLAFGGADYTAVDPGFGPFPDEIVFVTSGSLADYTDTPALDLIFDPGLLTDAGGTIGLNLLSEEAPCGNAECSFGGEPFREVAAGDVTTGAVSTPEPSTLLLLGAGLLGLFFVAKRKGLHAKPATL